MRTPVRSERIVTTTTSVYVTGLYYITPMSIVLASIYRVYTEYTPESVACVCIMYVLRTYVQWYLTTLSSLPEVDVPTEVVLGNDPI